MPDHETGSSRQASAGSLWAPVLVLVLVAGVTVAVALAVRDDSTTDVTATGPTEEPAQTPTVATPSPAASSVADTGGTIEATLVDARGIDVGTSLALPSGGIWLLPWGTGFLEVWITYPEPRLATPIPDDVLALFPDEIIELFETGEDIGIGEAQERIAEAGLTEELDAVLLAHPDIVEMLFDPGSTQPTMVWSRSDDGADWAPVEVDLPFDASGISHVASDGRRLAITTQTWSEQTGTQPSVSVHVTDDLDAWDSHDIGVPAPPEPLPAAIRFDSHLTQLLVNDLGWLAIQEVHAGLDPELLLGDRFPERGGSGLVPSADGVVIEIYPEPQFIYDEEGNIVGEEEPEDGVERIELTWDEIGLTPEQGRKYLHGAPQPARLTFGAWDVPTEQSTLPADGWIHGAGTTRDAYWVPVQGDDGHRSAVYRSSDGRTWAAIELPEELEHVEALTGVDGGVLARGFSQTGPVILLSTDDGASWSELTIPTTPQGDFWLAIGPPQGGATGAAWILEFHEPDPRDDIVVDAVTYEHEGYEITTSWSDNSTSIRIVDAASGEVVVDAVHAFPDEEEIRAAEEAGTIEELWKPPPWIGDDDGFHLTYVDPDTGDVIVEVPFDVEERAHEEAWEAALTEAGLDPHEPMEYRPELWLAASSNGTDWLVDPLDYENEPWPLAAATNGDLVAVSVGGQRLLYELRSP